MFKPALLATGFAFVNTVYSYAVNTASTSTSGSAYLNGYTGPMGAWQIINQCPFELAVNVQAPWEAHTVDPKAYAGGTQKIATGSSYSQPWVLLSSGGWSMKMHNSMTSALCPNPVPRTDSTAGIDSLLQFEYNWDPSINVTTKPIWLDMSLVNGVPECNPFEWHCTGCDADLKQMAYLYPTDDSKMQVPEALSVNVAITACPTKLSTAIGTATAAASAKSSGRSSVAGFSSQTIPAESNVHSSTPVASSKTFATQIGSSVLSNVPSSSIPNLQTIPQVARLQNNQGSQAGNQPTVRLLDVMTASSVASIYPSVQPTSSLYPSGQLQSSAVISSPISPASSSSLPFQSSIRPLTTYAWNMPFDIKFPTRSRQMNTRHRMRTVVETVAVTSTVVI